MFVISVSFFVFVLVDLFECFEGVDGYFVDGLAHVLQGHQCVVLDRVHEQNGRKDQQDSDEHTPDQVYIGNGSFNGPIPEDDAEVAFFAADHLWFGEVVEVVDGLREVWEVLGVGEGLLGGEEGEGDDRVGGGVGGSDHVRDEGSLGEGVVEGVDG